MQEDDHQPSDNFLIQLGQFLQACGREVPFAIPQKENTLQHPTDVPEATPSAQYQRAVKEATPFVQYRQALRNKDWTSALDLKKQ